MAQIFISRQPVINLQSKIIAMRFRLHGGDSASKRDIARTLSLLDEHWSHGEKLTLIYCPNPKHAEAFIDWEIPPNAVLELSSAALESPAGDLLFSALEQKTPAICLRFDGATEDILARGLATRFIGFDTNALTATELKAHVIQMQKYGVGIGLNVFNAQSFESCISAGLHAASSWFFKHPTQKPAKAINPAHAQIIRVLNLVRQNADIRHIEEALKNDITISYKLLRYINSVGFGLSCEIQSFRHAVTILGYSKLHRWLSLLLATASKAPMAPALMHTALTRARFMELLGQGLIDRQEHDNLFITGAFSMLDILLGTSMEAALETMHLPEPIADALLGRSGVYTPFLDLVKTSEGESVDDIAEKSALLGLSSEQFNSAHIQALSFANSIEF